MTAAATVAATAGAPAGPKDTASPPSPTRISPNPPPTVDPRKVHSQPSTAETSVHNALTDLPYYSNSNGTSAAAAAAAAAAPDAQDPRVAASQQATLTQQLQAANALNQQLQASAITQQMHVDSLRTQLSQRMATPAATLAAPAAAPQYHHFHQYPPSTFASAPSSAVQQQQQQLQALSQQLQLNAYLHQQQQQQQQAAAVAVAAQQQGLTSSPQLTAALQGVALMPVAASAAAGTSPQQQAALPPPGQGAQQQPTATVVTTGAGRQQVLLTPAGVAAALGSAAATAPAALTMLHQAPSALVAAGQAAGVLAPGSLSASTTTASVISERSTKIKLLLSSGGLFDKCTSSGTWEYHGGETRLVTVAHTPQFHQLLEELSKGTTTVLHDERVQLKYELPGSPDVLVDLINDDDVDNMWDEWQSFTLTAKPTYKLHVFVQLLETPPASSAATTPSSSAAHRTSGGSSQSGGSAGTPHAAMAATVRATVEASEGTGTITTQPRVDLLDLEGKLELIPPCDLTIVKFLGSGGYGEVYLSRWHSSDVAVKCLNPSLFTATEGRGTVSEEVVGELVKEANMLGSLRHPNVVWVYGLVLPTGLAMQRLKGQLEPGQSIDAVGFAATAANQAGLSPGLVRPPALVTEYLAGGSLRAAITRKEEWLASRSVKIKLMLDTARGMEYLHAKRIVHFDLKSGNLLIGFQNRAPVCKVADFGLSKQRQQTYVTGVTSMRGTLPWTAPEIIRTPKAVDEKVDVYSFGICMWEVWTGREPFEGINYHALLHMMTQQNGLRPPLPGQPEWDLGELEEPAEGWVGLMTQCWSDLPAARPTFVEIVRELQAMLAAARASRRAASA